MELFGFGVEKLCGPEMVEQAHDGEASEVGTPVFEFVAARGNGPDRCRAIGFHPGAEGVNDLVVGEVAPLDLDEGDFVGWLAVKAEAERLRD